MAHPRETPIALHSVAHRVSHQTTAESENSCQNRATPPPNQGVAPFSGPPPLAGRGPRRGGGSRQAGGGYRGTFGFRKRIALQGGVAATVTPSDQSRYSVQLRPGDCTVLLREAKPESSQTRVFPTFSGKVQIVIGRERGKGQIGKIPGPSPSKSGKSRKNRESPKKDKKGRTSPDQETPPPV